jgi:hypothetical protein
LRREGNVLSWCNACKEPSMKVKVYTRKADNKRCRVEICLNKGCRNKRELPFPEELIKNKEG